LNRTQRNNNPLNLRFSRHTGAEGQDQDGFATFTDPMSGWRAAHEQIRKCAREGLTVKQGVLRVTSTRGSELIDFVTEHLRISPDTPLKDVSPLALAAVIAGLQGYYIQQE
jgi:hypothetical protein